MNNSSPHTWRPLLFSLALLDAIAFAGSFFLAFWLRISSGLLYYGVKADLGNYVTLYFLSLPLFLFIFYAVHLYDSHDLFYGTMEYVLVTKAVSYGIIAVIVLGFFHSPPISRVWVVLFWLLAVLMINLGRFAFRRLIRRRFRAGLGPDRVLIIGANEEAKSIAERLIQTGRMEVVGFLDDFNPIGQEVTRGIRINGVPGNYEEIAHIEGITHIILVPEAVGWETAHQLLSAFTERNGLQISLSPGFAELSASLRVSYVGYVPLLRFRPGYGTGLDKLVKSGIDLIFGTCLMVLSLPVMILIILWILLRNGLPIFEKEEILGRSGVPLKILSFRIGRDKSALHYYYPDTQNEKNSLTNNTSRFEDFLLCYSVERLPQLFSVILGRMSLVGPRPITKEKEHQYGIWLPNLLAIKPGMTGPWWAAQNTLSIQHEITQTLSYIQTWTPWKDLQILLLMVFSILQRFVPKWILKEWHSNQKDNASNAPVQGVRSSEKSDGAPLTIESYPVEERRLTAKSSKSKAYEK